MANIVSDHCARLSGLSNEPSTNSKIYSVHRISRSKSATDSATPKPRLGLTHVGSVTRMLPTPPHPATEHTLPPSTATATPSPPPTKPFHSLPMPPRSNAQRCMMTTTTTASPNPLWHQFPSLPVSFCFVEYQALEPVATVA
jgi:hypothetical protein